MSIDTTIYTEAMKAADRVRECLEQLDSALQDAARHTALDGLVIAKWNCDKTELEKIHYEDDGKPFFLNTYLKI